MKDKRLERNTLLALVGVLGLTVIPHVFHVSPWISGFFYLLAVLRVAALFRPRVLPGRFLLLLLTFAGLANVIAHHRILLGRDAGVALLVSMLGLKLLETKTPRDLVVCLFLGYFLVVTHFLYYQSIGLALYLACVVVGLTAVLLELSRAGPSSNLIQPLGRAALLLAQAIPLMLVLFVLFPRLSGPLWNLDIDSSSAVTGLSDRLSPGSVSHLSQSRAVAFRVEFAGSAPSASQRYWRGPVFWETDGVTWHAAREREAEGNKRHPGFTPVGVPVDYTVTLEPTRQHWLFALDLPANTPQKSRVTDDFQLLASSPVNQERRYRLRSYPEYKTGDLSADERRKALQLPRKMTPRMRTLIRNWQTSAGEPAEIVLQSLNHFRSQPFIYTLNPPALGNNPTDEFLFETRQGFCEHYATSFTLLMRLAGVPARVVTGYQGGEHNPHGDYYIVRQSDAHAWSEVWLQSRGWVRIDPTAAVAPERIERPLSIQDSGLGVPVRFELKDPGFVRDVLRQAGLTIDAMNMAWRRWVLDYNDKRQNYLLSLLGLGFLQGEILGVTAILVAGLVFALIAAGLWGKTRTRLDPVEQQYRRFCSKLARIGLQRRSYEGPKDFTRRVVRHRPDLKPAVTTIAGHYIRLRYGPHGSRAQKELKQLKQWVQGFRPRARTSNRSPRRSVG